MKVSVVLPVFNGAGTIARAVESILSQTLGDFELIVVDDGSTDNTMSIVRQFKDARLKIVDCDHRGVVEAANLGNRLAQADLIARMDADDFSYPERLERQVQMLDEHQLDAVGCQVRILDANHQSRASMQRYEHWINDETLTSENISAHRFVEFPLVNPTILARRRYFELDFIDNGYPEDYDLMLRAAAMGMRFGKVAETLFDWIANPNGLTATHTRYSETSFMQCRRCYLLHGPLRDHRVVDVWGLGKTGKPWLRWLQSQEITVRRAYEIAERKVGKNIHGVTVQHTSALSKADGTPLIIAVGAESARPDILPQIKAKQFRPGQDAWFVA